MQRDNRGPEASRTGAITVAGVDVGSSCEEFYVVALREGHAVEGRADRLREA